jgi:hypothetical protein
MMANVLWQITASHALALGRAVGLPLLLITIVLVSVKVHRSALTLRQMAVLHVLEKASFTWMLWK